MRSATRRAIPLSEFRGGPRDAPWSDRDRLLAMGLDLYEADLCGGCGAPRRYSLDPDSKGHWHVPAPARCESCTVMGRAREKYQKNDQSGALQFWPEPDDLLVHAMESPLVDEVTAAAASLPGEIAASD